MSIGLTLVLLSGLIAFSFFQAKKTVSVSDGSAFVTLVAQARQLALHELFLSAWVSIVLIFFVALATVMPLAPLVGKTTARTIHAASALCVVLAFIAAARSLRRLSLMRGHIALSEASPHIVFIHDAKGRCIYVNDRWRELTGQSFQDALGFGWRSVAHAEDVENDWRIWENDLKNGTPHEAQIRYRAAHGTYFWHVTRAVPIYGDAKRIVGWIGTASNIDRQVRAAASMRFLANASEALSSSLQVRSNLERLVKTAAFSFADFASVWLVEDHDFLREVAKDFSSEELAQRFHEDWKREVKACSLLRSVLQGAGPYFSADISRETNSVRDALVRFNIGSVIFVPLDSGDKILGALVLMRNKERSAFDRYDLAISVSLARRIGTAVEKACIYDNLEHLVEELRSAFLPPFLPKIDGITFEAIYRPAAKEAEVGGDWYDAFPTADGRVAISVGDIMGHGAGAAAAMVRIRETIRAAATSFDNDPASILAYANRALCTAEGNSLATAIFAIYNLRTRELSYASAGHPAPLIVRDGSCTPLADGRGVILGIDPGFVYEVGKVFMKPGDQIVLFTDGLIENERDISQGEQQLYQALATHETATAAVESLLHQDQHDDIALLSLHIAKKAQLESGVTGWRFHSDHSGAAASARASFAKYLYHRGLPDTLICTAELVFGELVGNVVRHAPGPIDIEVAWERNVPILAVRDRGMYQEDFPEKISLPDDIMSETGRGLFLIEQLVGKPIVRERNGGGREVSIRLIMPVESAVA